MFLNHVVHHRAQLGVYLRMNEKPVPSTYALGGRHDGVLAAFNLPDDLNRIAREPGIGRDDRPSFFDALRDKQAVERSR